MELLSGAIIDAGCKTISKGQAASFCLVPGFPAFPFAAFERLHFRLNHCTWAAWGWLFLLASPELALLETGMVPSG